MFSNFTTVGFEQNGLVYACNGCAFDASGPAVGATGSPPNNPETCGKLGGVGLMQARIL